MVGRVSHRHKVGTQAEQWGRDRSRVLCEDIPTGSSPARQIHSDRKRRDLTVFTRRSHNRNWWATWLSYGLLRDSATRPKSKDTGLDKERRNSYFSRERGCL